MSVLFPSLFDEILFWVVIIAGFASLAIVVKKAHPVKEPDKKRDTNEPRLTGPLFLLFILVVPIIVGYARVGVLPSYLFYPGLVVVIIGGAIVDWGLLTLGRFHSGWVRVLSDHRVIQRGPYRFVRHPMYAGEIIAWIGLGLALQSWVALVTILLSSSIYFGNRIRIEERFLAAELGDKYVQYMKSVKRVIPHVL